MLHHNFLVTMAMGDISKLPKITILHCFFPSKLISKCCNFSVASDREKGFSALVTCYHTIDLTQFLACQMSKIFWAMWGLGFRPLQTPRNRKGHIHLLATP
jgi:hypothetical protein